MAIMQQDAGVKVSFSRLITLCVANLRHQHILTHSTKLGPESLASFSAHLSTESDISFTFWFQFLFCGSAAGEQERKPTAAVIYGSAALHWESEEEDWSVLQPSLSPSTQLRDTQQP